MNAAPQETKSSFRRLVNSLLWFKPRRDRTASSQASSNTSSSFPSPEAFEQGLSTVFADKKQLFAGRLQLLDLAEIKQRLGDQWPAKSARAHDITQQVIRRHLERADLFTRYYDTYFIVFANLDKKEAQLKCSLIAEEIGRYLLGEEVGDDAVTVETVVITADRQIILEAVNRLELLTTLFDKAVTTGNSRQTPLTFRDQIPLPHLREEVSFIYLPMWNVQRNIVATYMCVPARLREGKLAPLSSGTLWGMSVTDLAAINENNLSVALNDLTALLRRGRRAIVSSSLAFSTLTNRALRESFISACQQIPADLRGYLILELTQIPKGTPQVRLYSMIEILKPFCRAVLIRIPFETTDFKLYDCIGVTAIGADLSEVSGTETELFKPMQKLADAPHALGLRTYILGLDSLSLTTAAVCAGYDYVNSSVVASLVGAVEGVHDFNPSDLYANFLPS